MRIESSSVAMASSRTYIETYQSSERLKYWVGNQRPPDEGTLQVQPTEEENSGVTLDISNQAKALAGDMCTQNVDEVEEDDILSDQDKIKIKIIEKFIQIMTGKKIKINAPKLNDAKVCEFRGPQANSQGNGAVNGVGPQQKGWGLEYDFHERYYESESTTFSALGIIKTADGKEINFSVDVSMSREFMSATDISVRAGDAKIDPLVINYEGNAANLTSTKFSFDIDVNGEQEQIAFAGAGSGLLAIDNNADGIINDGSELFGPQSGNGFVDLAAFDEDGNGWIDEGDSVFNNLRIWTKDEQGNDYLFALAEKDIGAIYLGNVATQFSVNDVQNVNLGEVASTGIFLKESTGIAGTIQHINLAI